MKFDALINIKNYLSTIIKIDLSEQISTREQHNNECISYTLYEFIQN